MSHLEAVGRLDQETGPARRPPPDPARTGCPRLRSPPAGPAEAAALVLRCPPAFPGRVGGGGSSESPAGVGREHGSQTLIGALLPRSRLCRSRLRADRIWSDRNVDGAHKALGFRRTLQGRCLTGALADRIDPRPGGRYHRSGDLPDHGPGLGPAGLRPVRPPLVERPLPALRRPPRAGARSTATTSASGCVARHADCLAVLRDRRSSSDSLNVAAERMPEGFRTPVDEDDPVAPGHARDATVPVPGPARPHPAARAGVQGLHPEGGRVAARPDPAGGRRAASTPPSRPARSTCWRRSPTRCRSGSSATCSVSRTRTTTASRSGPTPWPEASIPTSSSPPRSSRPAGEAVLQFSQYFFELLAERRRVPGRGPAQPAGRGRGRRHGAERGGAAVHLHPVAGGRPRDDGQPHRRRDPGPAAPPRPAGAVPHRSRGQPERHRGDAPLRLARCSSPAGPSLEDCEFGGVEFAAGDFAMLLLASGNHDPEQFDDPERFDIGRNPNPTSGSGSASTTAWARRWPAWRPRWHSPHWCGGRPTLALAADDVTYKTNVVLRGMESLPVSMRG